MLCIDRLTEVLTDLAKDGVIEFNFSQVSQDVIEIHDHLYGTDRFIIVAEIVAGRDVLLLTKMFPALEGDPNALRYAYLRLLNFNAAAHGVAIGIDAESGVVGATVTFKCEDNPEEFRIALLHYLNTMTTFMETYYDRLLSEMLELGVVARG
jgi:hypothetical protein